MSILGSSFCWVWLEIIAKGSSTINQLIPIYVHLIQGPHLRYTSLTIYSSTLCSKCRRSMRERQLNGNACHESNTWRSGESTRKLPEKTELIQTFVILPRFRLALRTFSEPFSHLRYGLSAVATPPHYTN